MGRKTFRDKFVSVLRNEPDNYLLPFLWVHNEDDALIIKEVEKIYQSGIRALCIESRTHEEFGNDAWWSDVQLILDECEKRGMDVWLLDDKNFPTGGANGKAAAPENSHLRKHIISEVHTDVMGPVKDSALIIDTDTLFIDTPDFGQAKLLKIVAYKRNGNGLDYEDEYIDFTSKYHDGMVWIDLPEGYWSVFSIYDAPACHADSIDVLNPEGVDILIDAVYQPMYEHFNEYFGNVFKGFFSDEPEIYCYASLPENGKDAVNGTLPFNAYVHDMLQKKWGDDCLLRIPALFYSVTGISAAFRVAYMDVITSLFSQHFSWKLGNWSREHGVQYIGHVIEDAERDTTFCSGAHYFRALDGQDMAGIDIVLNDIVPGFSDIRRTTGHRTIRTADNEYYYYVLGKLASSHAHIQNLKKGRAMCEIYGAYGWAEGLKMMKWLTDHMLVRGINYFVPHAFSSLAPDQDCPPHFYEGGTNPQFKDFRLLMEYTNRMSTLLNDGVHRCKVAVYYRAEAEWSGGMVGREKKIAKLLMEDQIDFDIISMDYLLEADIKEGKINLAKESYACLVVPKSEYIPIKALYRMKELAEKGVKIIFAGGLPEKSCEEINIGFLNDKNISIVSYKELTKHLRTEGIYDISLSSANKNLRYYRYDHNEVKIYMFFNEDTRNACNVSFFTKEFQGGKYIEYDAMENKAVIKTAERDIPLHIDAYNSIMIIIGCDDAEYFHLSKENVVEYEESLVLPDCYDISLAEGAENYEFKPYLKNAKLFNITSPAGITNFGGHIKYETKFTIEKEFQKCYQLRLEYVGETANIWINGKHAGARIIPPYRFDITDYLEQGVNKLDIVVTTHLGYRKRDWLSRYLELEPSGLLGSVEILSGRCMN